MGTWIEIFAPRSCRQPQYRRSLRGNVDRNGLTLKVFRLRLCRSLRGNVDRNVSNHQSQCLAQRRSLRGNVDRNKVDRVIADTSGASFPTWERG